MYHSINKIKFTIRKDILKQLLNNSHIAHVTKYASSTLTSAIAILETTIILVGNT